MKRSPPLRFTGVRRPFVAAAVVLHYITLAIYMDAINENIILVAVYNWFFSCRLSGIGTTHLLSGTILKQRLRMCIVGVTCVGWGTEFVLG